MEISLEFLDETFTATATITPDSEINITEFSFILSDSLIISRVTCNGRKIDYEMLSTITPPFRISSKNILVKCDDYIRNITIEYHGKATGWHNIITRDIKSLSYYSVWFPQDTSIPITHDKVIIPNGQDYFVVKGIYDKDVWEYGGKGYDPFNIVAYRKERLKTISNPFMNIYFIDSNISEQAEKSVALYREILDFYNGNLFKQIKIPILDIACVSPAITTGGVGYRRKDFMWCTSLGNNDNEIAWLNAHETAHIWCTGADCGTWEDWLNETTAEWASLLFAIHKNDSELFDYILKPKLKKANLLPPIKTEDGSRPDGVHIKGTVLFYEMYKLFGVDAVRKAVRLFTDIEHKTTASFVQSLYDMDESSIADFIKEGIAR